MADISKLKLPNGTEYDLKVYTNHIAPMMSKTFQGVIGTANTDADCTFFFGTIRPTDYYDIWKIKYKVHVHITGTASTNNKYAQARSEVTWLGSENTYQAYHNLNHIHNTSYRPVYYNTLYNLKKAGYDAGLEHAIGIGLRNSWNPYNASYPREVTVQILQCINCQFTFLDNMIKWSSLPNYNTTNYETYRQTDFCNNGLYETGDTNDVNYQNRLYYSNPGLKAYAAGGRYTLTFTKDDNYVLPITATDNSTSGGAKVYTTESFDPFGQIYYRYASGTIAANAQIANATLYRQILVDARYSFTGVLNGTSSVMSANNPVYLVCTPQEDGSAKLAENPLSFELPNSEDGLYYILLGYAYNTYQFELLLNNPVYMFKKGRIREVSNYAHCAGDSTTVNGHTVNSNVPTNAVFTDTKNTAGSTDSSKKLFLIGAETQAANPQTYSQDTAYVGTDGKLYSNSKVVLTGGSNASSTVTITPSTTDVYSMTSAGSVTAGTKNVPTKIDTSKFSGGSFTRGTFSQGTLPTLTFAMDTTDTKKLKITFSQGTLPTHAADSFTAAALQSGFYTAGTANTPTAVTLPGRSSSAIKAWTGYTAATAAAQTFTGSSS